MRSIAFVTGRFDYLVSVACRDADDLGAAVRALRRSAAALTETRIVVRRSRTDVLRSFDSQCRQ